MLSENASKVLYLKSYISSLKTCTPSQENSMELEKLIKEYEYYRRQASALDIQELEDLGYDMPYFGSSIKPKY